MSAPEVFTTVSSGTMLPMDLDILLPFSSNRKPWVSTASNGARPRVPHDSSNEVWNQPRCWSDPSKYRSAGHFNSGRCSRTNECVDPESNHTSTISFTCVHSDATYLSPRKRSGSDAIQASAPSSSNALAMRSNTAGSFNTSPVLLFMKMAMGTPHWR